MPINGQNGVPEEQRTPKIETLFRRFKPLLAAFEKQEEALPPCPCGGEGGVSGALCLKKLNAEEITHIHRHHLKRDFPPAETKPLTAILSRVKNGTYTCYGAYDSAGLAAYLFVSTPTDSTACLLDYFAVCEGRRGHGVGSLALPLLQKKLRDTPLLIEVEDPEDTDVDSIRTTRERRIAFYRNLGARPTGLHARVFGVNFCIYILGESTNPREGLQANYNALFSPVFRKKHVKYLD